MKGRRSKTLGEFLFWAVVVCFVVGTVHLVAAVANGDGVGVTVQCFLAVAAISLTPLVFRLLPGPGDAHQETQLEAVMTDEAFLHDQEVRSQAEAEVEALCSREALLREFDRKLQERVEQRSMVTRAETA